MLLIGQCIGAQTLPLGPDTLFSPYYHQRVSLFKSLPQTSNDIIFAGNSITDGNEWGELFNDAHIKNRGISGDITTGILNRIGEIIAGKPAKVFLMTGINDLAKGVVPDSIVKNIRAIVQQIQARSPGTRVYIQSILPVNPGFKKFSSHTNKKEAIKIINSWLDSLAGTSGYTFIDLYHAFADTSGVLKEGYTNDGLHLKGEAYLLWKHLVYSYIYDLNARPALIPYPEQVSWNEDYFPIYKITEINFTQKELEKEAAFLKSILNNLGYDVPVSNRASASEYAIDLKLHFTGSKQHNEAYELNVGHSGITIMASTPHGIFNGIQTLRQLWRDGVLINQCFIKDQPAFSWRGYMIDVGRNYIPMTALKQQIDVMSQYKLNVFHFHATEDIAWRIAIDQYPQLTAPENMLRNKGMYYSRKEIRELIDYCKERHILFVPEIDMPGHSAAFKKAMKTDMQSDSGMVYLKNILKEFCMAYDVPYIHIGADEVKITNLRFVPEMTQYIESLGRKVIGWQPGGNFTNSTIRQLWMHNEELKGKELELKHIDSRHLYINHMDPLEAVVTIFNRKIGNIDKESPAICGGTLCMWHDRAVRNEKDIFLMNPLYPGMLSFAERIWKGGGTQGWIANISDGNEKAFAEFEKRLLDHKITYFQEKDFPYVKQSQLQWDLLGPFYNNGNTGMFFAPETKKAGKNKPAKTVTGGTIVLRHWWAPLIKGAIDHPEENTTWYASTRIWSNENSLKAFWVGFNNLSRSPATDSPPLGEWDEKNSMIWVNGEPVKAPDWQRPGQKGNSEIPLNDEGYEYRPPTIIPLKKGNNKVLVKLPVAGFTGKDWQNPIKWMFTFVPVKQNADGKWVEDETIEVSPVKK